MGIIWSCFSDDRSDMGKASSPNTQTNDTTPNLGHGNRDTYEASAAENETDRYSQKFGYLPPPRRGQSAENSREMSPANRMPEVEQGVRDGKGIPKIEKVKTREDVYRGTVYRRSIFGEAKSVSNQHRVLLMIGATGAGKSTLINRIINYIFGVKWEDDYRLNMLIEDENVFASNVCNQTQTITSYTIYRAQNTKLSYDLTIIDTPGFGNTKGLDKDNDTCREIAAFFKETKHGTIDHIDLVAIVVPGPSARLTDSQLYIFNTINSIFERDITGNLIVLATFADNQKQPVIKTLEEANIRYCGEVFCFNNASLYTKNARATKDDDVGETSDSSDDEGSGNAVEKIFWKIGEKNVDKLLSFLGCMDSKIILEDIK